MRVFLSRLKAHLDWIFDFVCFCSVVGVRAFGVYVKCRISVSYFLHLLFIVCPRCALVLCECAAVL